LGRGWGGGHPGGGGTQQRAHGYGFGGTPHPWGQKNPLVSYGTAAGGPRWMQGPIVPCTCPPPVPRPPNRGPQNCCFPPALSRHPKRRMGKGQHPKTGWAGPRGGPGFVRGDPRGGVGFPGRSLSIPLGPPAMARFPGDSPPSGVRGPFFFLPYRAAARPGTWGGQGARPPAGFRGGKGNSRTKKANKPGGGPKNPRYPRDGYNLGARKGTARGKKGRAVGHFSGPLPGHAGFLSFLAGGRQANKLGGWWGTTHLGFLAGGAWHGGPNGINRKGGGGGAGGLFWRGG